MASSFFMEEFDNEAIDTHGNLRQIEDVTGYIHILKEQLGQSGGQGAVYRTDEPDLAIKLVNISPFDQGMGASKGQVVSHSQAQSHGKIISQIKGMHQMDYAELNRRFAALRLLPIPKNVQLTLPLCELKNAYGYVMFLLDGMQDFSDAFSWNDENSYLSNPWLNSLREDESSANLATFLSGYIKTGGLRRRIAAYTQACCVLSHLHSLGLVYCDFSGRNCFISTQKNRDIVWLIDADNLSFSESIYPQAVFTQEFAAPEIMNEGAVFSAYSDCYSFAISLFKDLFCVHPFKGKLMDQGDVDFIDDNDTTAYSGLLPWIFDSEDDSNECSDGLASAKDILISSSLMQLFERTFCQRGKSKPLTRPTMLEWYYALTEYKDNLIKCHHCSMHYDARLGSCPWCDSHSAYVSIKAHKDGVQTGHICHELNDKYEFTLPTRLLKGSKPSVSDETLCTLKFMQEYFEISNIDRINYYFSGRHNPMGALKGLFGTQQMPYGSIIEIDTTEGMENYKLEVTIHG